MCKRIDERIECCTCGYPGCESRYLLEPGDPVCAVEEAMGVKISFFARADGTWIPDWDKLEKEIEQRGYKRAVDWPNDYILTQGGRT